MTAAGLTAFTSCTTNWFQRHSPGAAATGGMRRHSRTDEMTMMMKMTEKELFDRAIS